MSDQPQPVDVHGGSGGIQAQTDRLHTLAGQFGAAASESLHSAFTLHGYLLHPGLATSGLIDPIGWAVFEGDLLDALDGPRGLTWIGTGCGLIDGELRSAAWVYEATDEISNAVHDELAGVLGAPLALAGATSVLINTGSPMLALQTVVTRDPELADTIADELGLPALLEVGAGLLPDGHGVARGLGTDSSLVAARPPRQLTDVIGELAHRNYDAHHGAVDVRILTLADGTRRAIVDITGTKSWSITATPDITSLTTNGRAIVGRRTSYEQGVLSAMHRAGVRPTDKVMLVGHSEGGMVAVNTARDAVNSGQFDVTHVVTAGSPIGLVAGAVPGRVKVLALENSRDVVPHLDGRANPDEPNVTTASSGHGDGTIGDDHSLEHGYVPVARDVQASKDASIRDFLTSADGYLRGTKVTTHAFQIGREY
ncbi:MAG: hypothetical protein ACR2LX_09950 [Jatrophihabitans sp.]